eukprot:GHVR01076454.1.p1 GENE.GHVR01076454.1~~GHVR01076454.1.p1  ORF type:complete len:204 (-),score=33.69 GHVR01076454.1:286-897(-)
MVGEKERHTRGAHLLDNLLSLFMAQNNVVACLGLLTTFEICETTLCNSSTVASWYSSLIEILHRVGLHVAASLCMNNSNINGVRSTGQCGTTAYIQCSGTSTHKCGASLGSITNTHSKKRKGVHEGDLFWYSEPFTDCGRCGKVTNECSVCRTPVRGLWVGCAGCLHGGHPTHIRLWFDHYGRTLCPSGCGHMCQVWTTGKAV